jgi:hypothetical protein
MLRRSENDCPWPAPALRLHLEKYINHKDSSPVQGFHGIKTVLAATRVAGSEKRVAP